MKRILACILCAFALVACNHEEKTPIQQCGGYDVQMTFSENGDVMNADINGDVVELSRVVVVSGTKYAGILNDTLVVFLSDGEKWTLVLDDDQIIDCRAK
jgi:membrane-bound inhibitor of C-type lysozyme